MPRDYRDLLSDDPAFPALEAKADEAPNGAEVLPPGDDEARRRTLVTLGVTTRSTLGALAHETGGVLVDHGWIRHLGSGNPRLPRSLGAWNVELGVPLDQFLIVADDAVGGVFAINAGALGEALGNVFYFAPDALEWEDTELGHSDFVDWSFEGDLATFYDGVRWDGWEAAAEALPGDRVLISWPPPWTKEGQNPASVQRKPVSAKECWSFQTKMAKALG